MAKTKQGRKIHSTQWAAQFAVASELCKRGYEVALTMGNHPIVDLMVISPKGVSFVLDVKGQSKRNPWPATPQKRRNNLFYVFAKVPKGGANEFFIVAQPKVNSAIKINEKRARERRKAKGRSGKPSKFTVVQQEFLQGSKDGWDLLPK